MHTGGIAFVFISRDQLRDAINYCERKWHRTPRFLAQVEHQMLWQAKLPNYQQVWIGRLPERQFSRRERAAIVAGLRRARDAFEHDREP